MKNKKWKKIISAAMAMVMTLSCGAGFSLPVKAAETEAVYAQFGTPKIDGVVDDVWSEASSYTLERPNALSNTSAEAKVLWDDNALYVLVRVLDDNLNASAANAYEQDSVEVFLDELYDKATSYQSDDVHYRVNYQNKRTTDNGELGRFYSATSEFAEVAGAEEDENVEVVAVSEAVKPEALKSKAAEGNLMKELFLEEATAEPEATQEPAATEEPTQAPAATEEPTQAPEATEAPTQEPEATEEPTADPAATEEPTADPEATEEPTEDPEATEEPTEEPAVVEKGYYVEACIRFENITPANGMELGFDAQVNACQSGSRSGTISIFDASGNAWSDPSLFGKLVLQGKGEGDVSGPFPYGLTTYLEEVKSMDLTIYTESTAVALTEKIEAAEALLERDDYTQEEIDEVKALIAAAKPAFENDEEIYAIIQEETAAYFNGQKSAKEVADIIQSRVSIFISENS